MYLSFDFGIPILGNKGASVHIREMVQAFEKEGHHVLIVTSRIGEHGENKIKTDILEILPDDPALEELPQDLKRDISKIIYHTKSTKELDIAIQKFQPDLIYERYSLFHSMGVVLANQYQIPHFLEVNSLLLEEQKTFRTLVLENIARAVERDIFERTKKIFVVSDILKKKLSSDKSIQKKIKILPNGVNPDLFSPQSKNTKILNKYQLKEKLVIGFTGSLKPWHGLETAIKSIQKVNQKIPNTVLLIVGEGPLWKEINKTVQRKLLPVILTGGIPHHEIPDYLSVMDIVIAPYKKIDNFYFSPLKVFEYMSMGKPVIVSDLGQLKNIIQQNVNGIKVKPDDYISLSKSIIKLSKDEILCNKIGQNARKTVLSKYTWSKNARFIIQQLL